MKTMVRPWARSRRSAANRRCTSGWRQGRGRLVENDDAGAGKQHARQFDQLLQADRQAAHAGAGVDLEAEAGQLGLCLALHARPVDDAAGKHRLHAEEHVLGHRQVGHHGQFLVHHADAVGQRVMRRMELDRLAVDAHLALEAVIDAGDDLHHRRLAGAVLADEAVDLALAEAKSRRPSAHECRRTSSTRRSSRGSASLPTAAEAVAEGSCEPPAIVSVPVQPMFWPIRSGSSSAARDGPARSPW